MMQKIFSGLLVLLFAGLVAAGSLFVVDARETVLVVQLGRVHALATQPGLHWKWPLLQTLVRVDMGQRVIDTSTPWSLTTQDQQTVLVQPYVRFQVVEPSRYYEQASRPGAVVDAVIQEDLKKRLQQSMAQKTLAEALRPWPASQLQAMTQALAPQLTPYGVSIQGFEIKRVLPGPPAQELLLGQMKLAQLNQLQAIQARTQDLAAELKARATLQKEQLLNTGHEQAQKIKAEGDAEAAKIYAAAYNQSPEFYRLYRSLESYRTHLGQPGDVLVLGADSELLRYLKPAGIEKK